MKSFICCLVLLNFVNFIKTTIIPWTPQLLLNSTNINNDLLDPERIIEKIEEKTPIYNLMDEFKKNNITVTLIIISEISDDYKYLGKKNLGKFTNDLFQALIKNEKKSSKYENHMLVIFSVKNEQMFMKTDEILEKKLSDKTVARILSHMNIKSHLQKSEYAKAAQLILQKVYDYTYSQNSESSGWGNAISFILLLSVCFCFGSSYCFKKESSEEINEEVENKLQRIKEISQNNIESKEYVEKSCVICLEELQQAGLNSTACTQTLPNKNQLNHQEDTKLNMPTQQKLAKLDCGHIFHPNCIAIWMTKQNNCPTCRTIIDKDSHQQSKPLSQSLIEIQSEMHPSLTAYTFTYALSSLIWSRPHYSPTYSHSNVAMNMASEVLDFGGGVSLDW